MFFSSTQLASVLRGVITRMEDAAEFLPNKRWQNQQLRDYETLALVSTALADSKFLGLRVPEDVHQGDLFASLEPQSFSHGPQPATREELLTYGIESPASLTLDS